MEKLLEYTEKYIAFINGVLNKYFKEVRKNLIREDYSLVSVSDKIKNFSFTNLTSIRDIDVTNHKSILLFTEKRFFSPVSDDPEYIKCTWKYTDRLVKYNT